MAGNLAPMLRGVDPTRTGSDFFDFSNSLLDILKTDDNLLDFEGLAEMLEIDMQQGGVPNVQPPYVLAQQGQQGGWPLPPTLALTSATALDTLPSSATCLSPYVPCNRPPCIPPCMSPPYVSCTCPPPPCPHHCDTHRPSPPVPPSLPTLPEDSM